MCSFCSRLTMAGWWSFYGNPFGFILRMLPVPFLKAVVLVISAVEYAAKNNIQRDRGPVITGTSPVAMFVQIPGQINQGAELFVFVMNQMGDVVLIGVEAKFLFLRVIIVAVRNAPRRSTARCWLWKS